MRQIDVLVDKVQQMPRPLPGPEGAERNSSLLLEQMQEAGRRQIGGRRAAGRRQLSLREILQTGQRLPDPRVDRAYRQDFAKKLPVEFTGGEAVRPLLPTQVF